MPKILHKTSTMLVCICCKHIKDHRQSMNIQMHPFQNEVLSPLISAYKKGYSCQYSLMKLCEEMRQDMDCNEVVALIIMDLSKTFDCLPHDLMAAKLIAYDMSHSAVKSLISYLRHRKQRVKIGSDTSDLMTILKGVP